MAEQVWTCAHSEQSDGVRKSQPPIHGGLGPTGFSRANSGDAKLVRVATGQIRYVHADASDASSARLDCGTRGLCSANAHTDLYACPNFNSSTSPDRHTGSIAGPNADQHACPDTGGDGGLRWRHAHLRFDHGRWPEVLGTQ